MVLDPEISRSSDTGRPNDYPRALEGFLLSKEVEQCSELTLVYYRRQLGQFLDFLLRIADADVRDIRRQHVELYLLELRKRELSPFSVRSAYTALRAFFNWCKAEEFLDTSPVRNIKAPKTPKVGKPFLPDGARETLLKLCPLSLFTGSRDAAVVELLWSTGMRRAECAGLARRDLDWDHNRIKLFGKGARERFVPFLPNPKKAVWRYLNNRQDSQPQLWLTEERRPITLEGFTEIMKRLGERSGLDPRDPCHIFRRTWAMRQLRAGIPIKQVQLVGGWESITVLEQYVRAMESEDAMSAKWA